MKLVLGGSVACHSTAIMLLSCVAALRSGTRGAPKIPLPRPNLVGLAIKPSELVLGAASLPPLNLKAARLHRAVLRFLPYRVPISRTPNSWVDLAHAKLDHAHLNNADISVASLDHADFTAANLFGSNLSGSRIAMPACHQQGLHQPTCR